MDVKSLIHWKAAPPLSGSPDGGTRASAGRSRPWRPRTAPGQGHGGSGPGRAVEARSQLRLPPAGRTQQQPGLREAWGLQPTQPRAWDRSTWRRRGRKAHRRGGPGPLPSEVGAAPGCREAGPTLPPTLPGGLGALGDKGPGGQGRSHRREEVRQPGLVSPARRGRPQGPCGDSTQSLRRPLPQARSPRHERPPGHHAGHHARHP